MPLSTLSEIIQSDPCETDTSIGDLVRTEPQRTVIDALGRMSAADLYKAIRATIPAGELLDAPDLMATADACSRGRGPADTLRQMLLEPMDRAYVIWMWSLRRPLAPQTVARERLIAEGRNTLAQRFGTTETLFPEFDEFDEDCSDMESGYYPESC